jgi:hypothetical protein
MYATRKKAKANENSVMMPSGGITHPAGRFPHHRLSLQLTLFHCEMPDLLPCSSNSRI